VSVPQFLHDDGIPGRFQLREDFLQKTHELGLPLATTFQL
jgi:hypothetical protein